MNKNYITQNWLSLLVIAVLVIFILFTNPFGCNKPKPDKVVTTRDTVTYYVQQPTQYVPQYTPTQTGSTPIINIPPQYQPPANSDDLLKKYIEVTERLLALNTFKDSLTLKDSVGNRVGVVNSEYDVTENKLKNIRSNYTLSFPKTVITNTTTITKYAELKNKLYIGGGITGSPNNLVNGANLGFAFQNKKDNIYQLQGGFLALPGQGLQPQVNLSYFHKIKLRKD